MNRATEPLNRSLVGLIAVALLAIAAVCSLWSGAASSSATATWAAASTRIGIVMGALWLALPTRDRPAAWANLDVRTVAACSLLVLAILLLRVPLRLLLPLALALAAIAILRRPKKLLRPTERPENVRRR